MSSFQCHVQLTNNSFGLYSHCPGKNTVGVECTRKIAMATKHNLSYDRSATNPFTIPKILTHFVTPFSNATYGICSISNGESTIARERYFSVIQAPTRDNSTITIHTSVTIQ